MYCNKNSACLTCLKIMKIIEWLYSYPHYTNNGTEVETEMITYYLWCNSWDSNPCHLASDSKTLMLLWLGLTLENYMLCKALKTWPMMETHFKEAFLCVTLFQLAHEAFQASSLPVEKTQCSLLTLHWCQDQPWWLSIDQNRSHPFPHMSQGTI